jgi:hypothetical protein
VAGAFQGLAVGLQAVTQPAQQGGHRVVADLVAQGPQFRGQMAQALGGPQQRRLRVAPGERPLVASRRSAIRGADQPVKLSATQHKVPLLIGRVENPRNCIDDKRCKL